MAEAEARCCGLRFGYIFGVSMCLVRALRLFQEFSEFYSRVENEHHTYNYTLYCNIMIF
jgi:hypothetical protein